MQRLLVRPSSVKSKQGSTYRLDLPNIPPPLHRTELRIVLNPPVPQPVLYQYGTENDRSVLQNGTENGKNFQIKNPTIPWRQYQAKAPGAVTSVSVPGSYV